MATAEQVEEALQQLQAQGARIAALESQLRIESARAQTVEQERSALTQILGAIRADRGSSMADTKGDRTALHVERDCRPGLRRVGTQSADVHACKVRRRHSHCSNLGRKTAKDRCQDLRGFAEGPLCTPGSLSLENKATKTNGSTTLMSLLENSMPTLPPSQPTHPAELFGTLEKERAWKPGDDWTVSTTPRRP